MYRSWYVYSDETYTAASVIANANTDLSLPTYGSIDGAYAVDDVDVTCENIVTHDPSGSPAQFQWLYKVKFGNPDIVGGADPEDDLPDFEWGGTDEDVYKNQDVEGNNLVNSAHDFYENNPPQKRRGADCTISFNYNSNPASLVTTLSWTTNSSTWNGVSTGNALIGSIRANKVYVMRGGISIQYWRVRVPMRFSRDGFKFKPIDSGFNEIVDGVKKPIGDEKIEEGKQTVWVPASTPQFLDGSGVRLAVGGTPVFYPTDGYRMIEEADWSSSGIPNPFA